MRSVISGLSLAVLLALAGCSSLGDTIGGSYAAITTVARTVEQECGNVEPGGFCAAGSLLDSGDVARIKHHLQEAKDATDDANLLYTCVKAAPDERPDVCPVTATTEQASAKLQSAQIALQVAKRVLADRGVTQ